MTINMKSFDNLEKRAQKSKLCCKGHNKRRLGVSKPFSSYSSWMWLGWLP